MLSIVQHSPKSSFGGEKREREIETGRLANHSHAESLTCWSNKCSFIIHVDTNILAHWNGTRTRALESLSRSIALRITPFFDNDCDNECANDLLQNDHKVRRKISAWLLFCGFQFGFQSVAGLTFRLMFDLMVIDVVLLIHLVNCFFVYSIETIYWTMPFSVPLFAYRSMWLVIFVSLLFPSFNSLKKYPKFFHPIKSLHIHLFL